MSDGRMVVLLDAWAPRPVYHVMGGKVGLDLQEGVTGNGEKYQRAFTACGRVAWEYRWREGDRWGHFAVDKTRIRRDHAELIGRPCAACLKKEAAVA